MSDVEAAGATAGVGADAVIDVVDLRMSYGRLEAVRGVDLRVRRGEVFAFLGPNGAGKTTTVEILEGYRRRTRRRGARARRGSRARRRLRGARGSGSCCRNREPERDLTVSECLRLFAGYFPTARDVGGDARSGGARRSSRRDGESAFRWSAPASGRGDGVDR